MLVSETLVMLSEIEFPVVFCTAPPVHVATEVQVPPLPVTISPPLDPVLLRTMPLVGPLAAVPAEMLRKVGPRAPMFVLVTFRAVPVVVAIVLVEPVTLTVPPPVALKALLAPVDNVTPPLNVIVPLVLLVSEMPLSTPP